MKDNKWTAYILLEDAGELSIWKRRALQRALRHDPALRAFRDDLRATRNAIRSEEGEQDDLRVPPFVLAEIEREARRAVRHREQASYTRPVSTLVSWRPAVVYATLSVLLLGLGLWNLWPSPPPGAADRADTGGTAMEEAIGLPRVDWDVRFEQEWEAFDAAWLAAVEVLDEAAWTGNGGDADAWARELLDLEGT